MIRMKAKPQKDLEEELKARFRPALRVRRQVTPSQVPDQSVSHQDRATASPCGDAAKPVPIDL